MVNVMKLKGKIIECGMSVAELANKIGVDKATLYRKLNSEGQKITIGEADSIAKALNLNSADLNAIFFSQYVA